MKPVKPQVMFAISDFYGNIWGSSVRYFRKDAIKHAMHDICGNTITWAKAKNRYSIRIVKVTVTPWPPLEVDKNKK